MKIYSCLLKIVKNEKIILNQRKFVKVLAWKKKGMSLLKTGFLVTLNLKEKQKIDDLKLFENWSGFKIIWRKLEFWKLIWKMKSRKLNFKKNGILKIKFKNGNFGN